MNTFTEQIETIEIPFKKLAEWQGNVRITASEQGIEELAASIASHGLLQSLVVRRGARGRFAVVAGRRRLLALSRLVVDGIVKSTTLIPCRVVNADTDLIEVSLAENVVREPMHPADECEAFQKLLKSGKCAADIAARFGVSEAVVLRRLALARVSPTLIQQYREGALNLEMLQAFTLTDDQHLQEQLWNQLQPWNREASTIRGMLSQDDIPASDKRVRFVTLDRYEARGGRIRCDLFADGEDGGYIQDPILLNQIVSETLAALATELQREGWKWVEVRPDQNHQFAARMRRLPAELEPLSPKRQAKLDALRRELAELEEQIAQTEEEGKDDPRHEHVETLERQVRDIEAKQKQIYSAETRGISGAIVALGWNGEPHYTYGLLRREDEVALANTPSGVAGNTESNGDQMDMTEEDEQHGYSAALLEQLSKHKTAAIAVELLRQPAIALAATVHALVVSQFSFELHAHKFESCVQISTAQLDLGSIDGAKAYDALSQERSAWVGQFPQECDLWKWCLSQDQDILLRLLAYCVGISVNAVQTKGDSARNLRLEHANRLAQTLGMDMTQWFRPTEENFFGRITKPQIIEAMKEAGHTPDSAAASLKKAQLASIATEVVRSTTWLPQPLRIATGDREQHRKSDHPAA
ncbi:MAG: ParB/RepB/Spo0J family partition protein [Acidobacteriota bacterium]|nr:ParB/RepB/Spo0J family partition protein [Acidobacteriota bacterium]